MGRVAQVNLLCLQRVGSVRRWVVLTRPACSFGAPGFDLNPPFVPCPAPILRKLTHPTFPPEGWPFPEKINKKKQVKKKSAPVFRSAMISKMYKKRE